MYFIVAESTIGTGPSEQLRMTLPKLGTGLRCHVFVNVRTESNMIDSNKIGDILNMSDQIHDTRPLTRQDRRYGCKTRDPYYPSFLSYCTYYVVFLVAWMWRAPVRIRVRTDDWLHGSLCSGI